MKKPFYAVSLVPSLLIASSVVFASNGSVMRLSDVSDSVSEILQEYKDNQVRPKPGEKPGQPGHQQPPKPGQPNHPTHPPKPDNPNHPGPKPPTPPNPHPPQPPQPQPPQPPKPVDTTHAYNAGVRDGAEKGTREGRFRGSEDGRREGEREGRRNGNREGDIAGRAAGKRDGYGVDQAAGTLNGSREGQSAGITNGTAAGERRCYDEGYSDAYNPAYAEAKALGLQDSASYESGYAKGQADAAVMEAENGQRAGYQAGFSQRETEIHNSFPAALAAQGGFTKGFSVEMGLPLELVSKGYTTPEEKRAYEKGYKEGYDRAYRREYNDAKRRAYDESYRHEYRRAYDAQYSISYRTGYTEGREEGYQDAYGAAYNSAYNAYFAEYKNREYSEQRSRGLRDGQVNGQREGFEAGCAEQNRRGYKAGYADMAAQVYPGAFEAGKQSGIAAADKYYAENAVLKAFDMAFYDENGDGKFEAGENVMLRAEIRNFGARTSGSVAISVRSERGEITLLSDLSAAAVGGRSTGLVNLAVGRLHDVVAPNSDALRVVFTENGKPVGDFRQMYTRTNPNKVGVVIKDGTDVLKKATWFFPGKVTELNSGDKVIITETKGDYYKVRKSEVAAGDWTEGYIKSDKLNLQ
ncbi:MAG TPA: hypothetical protein PK523_05685 [Elusimicrobiales bacterium]|nr:hypothetical protein [Elusimicrobiales bacterium]